MNNDVTTLTLYYVGIIFEIKFYKIKKTDLNLNQFFYSLVKSLAGQ